MNLMIQRTVKYYQNESKTKKTFYLKEEERILNLYNAVNFELVSLNRAMICIFCEVAFSIDNSNEACSQNRNFKSEINNKNYPLKD